MLVDAGAGYSIGEILVVNKQLYVELQGVPEVIYRGHMFKKM